MPQLAHSPMGAWCACMLCAPCTWPVCARVRVAHAAMGVVCACSAPFTCGPCVRAQKVMQLLRSTEGAVRAFKRAKLWREAPQQYKGGWGQCWC